MLPTTLAVLLAVLAFAAPAAAAPTDLDSLFASAGIYLDTTTVSDRLVTDTEVQSDGKILTISSVGSPSDIRISRFTDTGVPDNTFGTNGVKVIDLAGSFDHANDLLVLGDDSILVAGNTRITTGSEFALLKLEPDGDLDPLFGGGDGWIATPVGYDFWGYGYSVDVQTDGKIVVGGEADGNNTGTTDNDFAVARYNANGTIDTTFGFDDPLNVDPAVKIGWTTQSLEPNPNEKIVAVWAMNDGTILAAGGTQTGLDPHFALARFLSTGFIDTSFATNGHTTVPAISNYADLPKDAVMQADGKVVIVGETLWDSGLSGRSDNDFGIARLNTDGSMDSTFAGDGTLAVDFNLAYDFGNGVAIDECGRAVVVGSTGDGIVAGTALDQFAIARISPDGTLDTTFGGDGKFTQSVGSVDDSLGSVAIQPSDNKIVASGISFHSSITQAGKPVVERLAGGGVCTQPVPQAPPADAAPPVEAAARIATPRHNRVHRAYRLLKVNGAATGENISEVQIALRQEVGGRCVWLKSSTGKQRRTRRRGSCSKSTWLKANGTTDWSYEFRRKLRRGSYRLYARVKLADGTVTDKFISGENSIRFTVR
ncbi:MAG: hypothetical protein HZB14_01005 [Actinobacteria bacterium]|nr:hypothetical protein [Actinomycetota bacterium]